MSAGATTSGWAEHATRTLHDAGFRKGGARASIIDCLARQSCALSVPELEQLLRRRGRPVGRASIYRVLDQLSELALVQRLEVGHGMARYEPHGARGEHHHHLVCKQCGRLTAFHDKQLEAAIERISSAAEYSVSDHEVVLRGRCPACRS